MKLDSLKRKNELLLDAITFIIIGKDEFKKITLAESKVPVYDGFKIDKYIKIIQNFIRDTKININKSYNLNIK